MGDIEKEQRSKRAALLQVNALTFALMVRELLLYQMENSMATERDLLERQEKECAEIMKAFIDGFVVFSFLLPFLTFVFPCCY